MVEGSNQDDEALVRALDALRADLRLVFAAACVERLMPWYVDIALKNAKSGSMVIPSILVRLWRHAEGNQMSADELAQCLSISMSFLPDNELAVSAAEGCIEEDTAASLAYALRCAQTGRSEEAAHAAGRICDTLYSFVIRKENFDEHDLDAWKRLTHHPLIQAEEERQKRDLAELQAVTTQSDDTLACILCLRLRAKDEARSLFNT